MKSIFIVALVTLLSSCASNTVSQTNTVKSTSEDQLDIAIRETSNYFNNNLKAGNKLAILGIHSDSSILSNYINDELISNIINDKVFSIVERQQLDTIRTELNFQMSGEVDDNSAQRLGQMLGAQNIITGGITKIGDRYRLTVRALNVESAQIEGQFNRNISNSPTIDALIQTPSTTGSTQTASSAAQTSAGINTQSQFVDRSIPVPSGVRAVTESYSAIQVTWGPVPAVTEYKLFVSTASNGAYTFLANVSGLSYLHEGMTPNTTRFYRVSAVGGSGRESPLSAAVSGTTRQIPSPTGLTAEAVSPYEIRLVWDPVAGATYYRVYGSDSSGNTQPLLISTNENIFIHGGLQQMSTYYYRVSAVLNELEGGQSTVLSASTPQAPVIPPGNTLAQQLDFIANQGGNGTVYEIIINDNVNLGPTTISTRGRNITVIMRSENPSNTKTIELTGRGHLFTVDANITLRLQDIILKGNGNNNRALVLVGPAKLVLDSGSKIIGNKNNFFGGPDASIRGDQRGGGVRVNGGTLEMNEGAEISGNIVQDRNVTGNADAGGAGIIIENHGTAIIRGGIITGNHANVDMVGFGRGGGIYITGNSTVSMSGGVISRNRADGSGGGVYISSGSTFTKRGAPGNDTSGIIYGSVGDNANIASGSRGGHGIHQEIDNRNQRQRNTTLSYYDDISTALNDNWGQ